ncbi:unnamed protein product [Chilo suppressalis]|uniref:Chemosensory protein n=1 Tax=Chilo suppressalis TaxID=168631 RepID=A0ABN8B4T3_CHISP|nr:unnamed protein product [Chilo suppressalis]
MHRERFVTMAIFVMLASVAQQVMCYDEKYDKMEVDKIIANDELFNSYLNCWLDKGPCDKENAAEMKTLMPEVISTACGKCTPVQKKNIKKLIQGLTTKQRAHQLKELMLKYDPKREYFANFAKFLLGPE